MFDDGVATEPVSDHRLHTVTEEWTLHPEDDYEDIESVVGSVLARCLNLKQIGVDGVIDLTVDVLWNGDRFTVRVDVPRVVCRFDMDGRC